MPSTFTEQPISSSEVREKKSDNLEAEAVGLEVPVRIHGSQVTAVVLDTTEHVEPFEEDSSTMIVFPRGAVVKLQARVRTGHAAVVTNLKTKRAANCRIVQVNPANAAHYVKLEFTETSPGFWGVPFASEQQLGANSAVQEQRNFPDVAADSNSFSGASAFEEPAAPVRHETAHPIAPVDAVKPPALPTVNDEKPMPAANSTSYDFSERASTDIVPLAAAPVKSDANGAKSTAPVSPAIEHPASASSKPSPGAAETAIFDSLSTDEDVFGPEKSDAQAAHKKEKHEAKAPKAELEIQMRSFADAAAPTAAPRKSSRAGSFAAFAAVILIAAGGGWYLLRHRGQSTPVGSAVSIGNVQSSTPAPSGEISAAPNSSPAAIEPHASQGSQGGQNSSAQTEDQTASSGITITPIHNTPASSGPASAGSADAPAQTGNPAPAAALPNIFAGDTARPVVRRTPRVKIPAAPPQINAGTASGISVPANTALGRLVEPSATALPAPPKPESSAVKNVKGGKIVEPRLIHSVPLEYPAIAINSHVEGDVQVQAVVDAAGRVISAKAISGPGLLRNAAVNAVRQWRYSPATLDGKPIQMPYVVTVRFRLNQ